MTLRILLALLMLAKLTPALADGYCYIGYIYDAAGQRVKRHYYCVSRPDEPCYDCPVDDEPPPVDSRPSGQSAAGATAIEGRSMATATVFPNPTPGPFVLVVPVALRPCDVVILTASGSILQRVKVAEEETEFDLTRQAPGTYYIRLIPSRGKPQYFQLVKR